MVFKFKNFFKVSVVFGLTQVLGIYAAYNLLPQFLGSVNELGFDDWSWYDFLILAVFFFVFVFVTSKFKKGGSIFFKIILSILIFSGSRIIFSVWAVSYWPMLIALFVVIVFWLMRNVFTHNLVMILTISGIGASVGLLFEPVSVVYLLIAFSFYDIISVYKTGHMIKLAKAMMESRAIFGFVIPEEGRSTRDKISQVTPGQGFMILGSGDVVFPLLLSVSLLSISIFQACVVAIFSVVGLFLMHTIFNNQKTRRPMAALPPISLMAICGYLVSWVLK